MNGRLWVILLFFSGFSRLMAGTNDTADPETERYLTIHYAYNNPCELCRDDVEFFELFNRKIRDVPDRPFLSFQSYNLFHQGPSLWFDKLCGELGISREKLTLPVLIIGNEYIEGDGEIYNGARDLYIRQKETAGVRVKPATGSRPLSDPVSVKAPAGPPRGFPPTGPDNSTLVCFVTTACESCAKIEELLDKLPGEITLRDGSTTPLDIYYFNVAESEGLPAVRLFFEAYAVPEEDQLTPIVFYSGGYLSGLADIQAGLEEVLVSGSARNFTYPGIEAPAPALAWQELPAIFLAGLLGGVNPCSVSMLLLLLSLLGAKSGRVLSLGLTYVASRMITYLALGLSLFSLGQILNQEAFTSIAGIIRVMVIALSLLLCVLNLADFINARRENYGAIRVQLPKALRRFNHRLINRVTGWDPHFLVVGIFLLGVVVSAGEFLCTGQIYLATILYLLRTDSGGRPLALMALLCYTLAASLPPAMLVLFCYKGKQALALSEFVRKKMPVIKIANAVLFALFALLAFLFF
jgi:cytochrome c biogenesis protein CcdA